MIENINDYAFLLVTGTAVLFELYLTFKYIVIKDLRKPFLGVSSAHLVVYLFVSVCSSIYVMSRYFFIPYHIEVYDLKTFYLLNTTAAYSLVAFYVKRFSYNNISDESSIMSVLEILYTITLTATIIAPERGFYTEILDSLAKESISTQTSWIFSAPVLTVYHPIALVFRFAPTFILFTLWYISITKPFKQNSLNFYPKSANKSILLFFLSDIILSHIVTGAASSAMNFVFCLAHEAFKYSMIMWLQSDDIKLVERNLLIRSKQHKKR